MLRGAEPRRTHVGGPLGLTTCKCALTGFQRGAERSCLGPNKGEQFYYYPFRGYVAVMGSDHNLKHPALGAELARLRGTASLREMGERLGLSAQHIHDFEAGRRLATAERAAAWGRKLKQDVAQFVELALRDELAAAGLDGLEVHVVARPVARRGAVANKANQRRGADTRVALLAWLEQQPARERLSLVDVRRALSEHPRAEVDNELLELERLGQIVIVPLDNPHELTPEREAAALHVAGVVRHMLYRLA